MHTVEEFTHKKVIILRSDATVHQAARAICDNKVGCVVVIGHSEKDKGKITGIVTDRDLVCGLLAVRGLGRETILSEIMTEKVISASPDATISELSELMIQNGIRRIPVIEQSGTKEHCVGIVTLDDLVAAGVIDLQSISQIVKSQIRSRATYLSRIDRWRSIERSRSKEEQTLEKFYSFIRKDLDIDHDQIARLAKLLLGYLVRRIHYTGAVNLISQLPKILQNELYDLPAGPDRSVTKDIILKDIQQIFNTSYEIAESYAKHFLLSLGHLISQGELEHVKAQLPNDLKELFEFLDAA
ncbi:MAG: CBS domain-containing protein [Bacteriovoracia bacterium]